MELMELYDNIENPIKDPKVIEKLIKAYANTTTGFGGFYGQLTRTVQKEYAQGQCYRKDVDKFYSMMFNKWKNNIIAMHLEEFIELYKQGIYGKDFMEMRSYLKTVPDVATIEEANNVFFSNEGNKTLENALRKYKWTSLGDDSGWVHVCSRYVTAMKDQFPNVEHRLYLDTESLDTYKMITLLVEKCDEHQLPYYFKFDEEASRDDTIVMYSSTENLTEYVEILGEIKKEHPELVSRIKEPPILAGKIDGWIGYGSEPSKTPDGINHSFNDVRSKAIEPAISKTTKEWIMTHRNKEIIYKNQKVSFQNYLAMKSTEELISDLESRFIDSESYYKKVAQGKGENYDQFTVINKLGYTLQDVRSSEVIQNIYKIISKNMDTFLPQLCNYELKNVNPIVMNVRNEKQITFTGYKLEQIIKELSVTIAQNDSSFISSVQEQIKINARQYGIDVDKFCFDIKTKEKMKIVENKNDEKPKEMKDEKQGIDMSLLDIQTLPKIINPTLIEKGMKLPSGDVIPSEQYIQKIVYPHLPENGLVILSNCDIKSVKEFIEDSVMLDCQERYNGDFPKYMAENTRNNIGVISIENNGEKHIINPVDIIDFIDPDLLDNQVKLPNGVEVSARQYIQELYAPHIPTNGQVLLNNGVEIPVKQFIEKELLCEGQEKYNGNISQILYYMTRNNLGNIESDTIKIQNSLIEMSKQIETLNQQPIKTDMKR